MLRKLIILFIIFSLAFFAVTELVLPAVAARAIRRGLADYLGGDVSAVVLEAHPAMKMLLGRFDKVSIETNSVDLGGLLVDSLSVTVNNLSLSMGDLLLKREFKPRWDRSLGLVVRVSEQSLNQFIWANVPNVTSGRITLEPERAVVVGNLVVRGQEVPVRAEGRFVVSADAQVAFIPTAVSISGVPLSQEQLALIRGFGGLKLALDLGKLSPPLTARDVKTASGQLTIIAEGK